MFKKSTAVPTPWPTSGFERGTDGKRFKGIDTGSGIGSSTEGNAGLVNADVHVKLQVVPFYNPPGNRWIEKTPRGTLAFISTVDPMDKRQEAFKGGKRLRQLFRSADCVYCLTPERLNWALHAYKLANHGEYPITEAYSDWRLMGMMGSSAVPDDNTAYQARISETRTVDILASSDCLMTNYWGEEHAGNGNVFLHALMIEVNIDTETAYSTDIEGAEHPNLSDRDCDNEKVQIVPRIIFKTGDNRTLTAAQREYTVMIDGKKHTREGIATYVGMSKVNDAFSDKVANGKIHMDYSTNMWKSNKMEKIHVQLEIRECFQN